MRGVGEFLVDVVYPRRCAGCGRRGAWVCGACEAAYQRFSPPWCATCGVPLALSLCRCDDQPTELSFTRSVGPYAGWMREAITHFKYHGEWARAELLGRMLAGALTDVRQCSAIVPVPLHASRLRERGFNQSQLLAREIGKHLSLDVAEPLIRVRKTQAQARLPATERMANVSGAFGVREGAQVRNGSFILVDDVLTTGSTLSACATALLNAGATSVGAVTLARDLQ